MHWTTIDSPERSCDRPGQYSQQAPCLPLHRNTSQTNSITANCIMDTPSHIWLNLISEMNDKVLYGYWMSPDLEDGWGFVVAAVDQLYNIIMSYE
ncbi:hypothetical protein IEQ34_001683 [Dendrobium chrysotoxum]|uniref:Uncharacterized protein n=1 Tax=Dendrobium chrysotoxum TaxID=161865 RepID=A0AAV7HPQ0_DENCH|nr:hypothetical protein IEQ34_001683 [Dendrobium chrysotoxum]